ncbi:MAG: DivIVA domain-containing protein [bacterium]
MKITPIDIKRQVFKKVFRGYDSDEVNAFLEMIAAEYEKHLKEISQLNDTNMMLSSDLGKYSNLEKTLQATLIAAQKTTEEIKTSARKEAELIVKEAEIQAEQIIAEARKVLIDISNEIDTLKTQKRSFCVRFKSLLTGQLELLGVLEGEGNNLIYKDKYKHLDMTGENEDEKIIENMMDEKDAVET